jgi:hypothetical protein
MQLSMGTAIVLKEEKWYTLKKSIPKKLLTRVPTKMITCGDVCPSLCRRSAGNELARSPHNTTSIESLLLFQRYTLACRDHE